MQGLLSALSSIGSITGDLNALKVLGVLNLLLIIVVLVLAIIILVTGLSKGKENNLEKISVASKVNAASTEKNSVLAKTNYNRRIVIK